MDQLIKILVGYGPAGLASALLVLGVARVYLDQRRDLAEARAALAAAIVERDAMGHSMLQQFSERASDSLVSLRDLMGLVQGVKEQGGRVEAELRERRRDA